MCVVYNAAQAAALTKIAALVFAAAAMAGCGSTSSSAPAISWEGKPIVVRQAELPDDTIVSGTLRNGSARTLDLEAADVKVVTAQGAPVQSTARFTTGVTHQLYPPREGPHEKEPAFLRERLGETATVKPGGTTPFVVSWRVSSEEPQPVKVELGEEGSLPLP
jgi:hypothetical protein